MEKNLVSYKALRFTTESNRSSMLYEVKRARAVWDPSLSVPGTNRRGGYRCPVGTRYGGQITDRFGRNCGWGVARRLANEISDLGERLENVGDRRRDRELRKRNERMAGRLAGQAGALERMAGRIGDAADVTGRQGGRRNRVGTEAPRPAGRIERAAGRIAEAVDPDRPQQGRAQRAATVTNAPSAPEAPRAPRGRRQVQAEPRPAAARRPRRNLRPSEERRMQREIDQPNAPRTGEAAPAPRQEPRPRPAAPRRPANAGRRRQPAEARRTPSAAPREATPAPAPRVTTPAPRAQTPEPAPAPRTPVRSVNVPDDGLGEDGLRKILGDKFNEQLFERHQQHRQWQINEQLPNDMAAWRQADIGELEANIQLRDEAIGNHVAAIRERARIFANEPTPENAEALMEENFRYQSIRDARNAMKVRIGELRNPPAVEPEVPEPSAMPEVPNPPAPSVPSAGNREPSLQPQPMRITPNDNVRARNEAQWRQFFEAQNEEDIPVRIQRAMDAARNGSSQADTQFANEFGADRDARMRIRDRDDMVRRYDRQLQVLNDAVERERRAYEGANPQRRDDYRMAQRNLIEAIARRDRYAERRADIDEILAQPAPEPLNPELARKAEARVKDAIAKRQKVLGKYLDRRYGEGNAPWKEMTLERRQELLAKFNNGALGAAERNAAKAELENWAKEMYSHAEIQGSNGKTYRTVVNANLSSREISISGVVQVKNADGSWTTVGRTGRTLYLNENRIYNNSLIIDGEAHKNNGIQTIYNQHAFMYAKAAGFEKVGVTAAHDGPYVWGRIGFEPDRPLSAQALNPMQRQLAAFRRGDASIIKNEEDANIIDYLIQKHADNPASVRHMDFIYALSNTGQNERARRSRDTELKNWFVANMPMGGGTFWLDKNLIKADPRD